MKCFEYGPCFYFIPFPLFFNAWSVHVTHAAPDKTLSVKISHGYNDKTTFNVCQGWATNLGPSSSFLFIFSHFTAKLQQPPCIDKTSDPIIMIKIVININGMIFLNTKKSQF
jgi:hypothetical protein